MVFTHDFKSFLSTIYFLKCKVCYNMQNTLCFQLKEVLEAVDAFLLLLFGQTTVSVASSSCGTWPCTYGSPNML